MQLEYKGVPADKPVDFALLLQRRPVLFIEAKTLGENLRDRRWASQVVSYAAVAGVEWVVLTDGDEYRIYNALSAHDVEDKLFRSVSVSGDPRGAADALRLLTKDELRNKSLAALWHAQSVDNRVQRAVSALFEPEPSPWLVRKIASVTEGLTAGDVKAALSRGRITFDIPAAELPAMAPAAEAAGGGEDRGGSDERRRRRHRGARDPRADRGRTAASYDASLKDLLDAGLIQPGLELRKRYLGTDLRATVEPDGRVRVGSEVYKSLSIAGGAARVIAKGPPADGRRYYQTNGWSFWQYTDEAGRHHELDEIRQRYLAERSSRGGRPG